MVKSHFVELDFSPRTVSVIQQGSPFAEEVRKYIPSSSLLQNCVWLICHLLLQFIDRTSEWGITVRLDVLDQHGASFRHQTINFNRTTSTMIFTVSRS
jgi:hypothetical protein